MPPAPKPLLRSKRNILTGSLALPVFTSALAATV